MHSTCASAHALHLLGNAEAVRAVAARAVALGSHHHRPLSAEPLRPQAPATAPATEAASPEATAANASTTTAAAASAAAAASSLGLGGGGPRGGQMLAAEANGAAPRASATAAVG